MYSCRQMAYDFDLMNIVDLIDIFNKKTDSRIINYLIKRKLLEKKNKEIFLKFNSEGNQNEFSEQKWKDPKNKEKYLLDRMDNLKLESEKILYKEVDNLKLPTDQINSDSFSKENSNSATLSTFSILTNEEKRRKPINISENLIKKTNKLEKISMGNDLMSLNRNLEYESYTLKIKINNNQNLKLKKDNERKYTKILQCDTNFQNGLERSSSLKFHKIPDRLISYNKRFNFYTKNLNKLEPKHLSKFNNFYYLKSLSNFSSSQSIFEKLVSR